jgi:hypothetical protein
MLKSTLEKNLKIAEDRVKSLEAEGARLKKELGLEMIKNEKVAQPLHGVRTNLNGTPAYIITVGDYKRLGGE